MVWFAPRFSDEMVVLQLLLAVFAAAIAVGVVYNNARIALEIRSRDLATLPSLASRVASSRSSYSASRRSRSCSGSAVA